MFAAPAPLGHIMAYPDGRRPHPSDTILKVDGFWMVFKLRWRANHGTGLRILGMGHRDVAQQKL